MTDPRPQFHGRMPFVAASKLLEATGEALRTIKEQENLTWKELGTAIGMGDDQTAKYGSGNAEMGFTTWLRATQLWNGRFSVAATMMGLSIGATGKSVDAGDLRQGMLSLTLLLAEIQKATLDDTLDDDELVAMDALIDRAGQFLECMRLRLAEAKSANAERRLP